MSADQHLHRTATRLSLDAGLGQRGYVNAPDDLWIHHNLPFQLPPHPPVLHKPSASAYDTLTILRSLCRDHFCFPIPAQGGARLFTTYKLETQTRLIADLRT